MAVTVTVVASAHQAAQVGFYSPVLPSAQSIQAQVTTAYQPGSWLVAVCSWHQPTGGSGPVTVSVADDPHNWWEPLGEPSASSGSTGVTRCSVWAAPAAQVATYISMAPTDFILSGAITVLAVTGLSPWLTLTSVTSTFTNAGTALSALTAAAPPSQAFWIAACASDINADTISVAGAGWTALTAVTASNGTDTTSDLTLSPYWQTATGTVSATFSSSGTQDLSGVLAGFLVTGTSMSAPNANWPLTITEMALGGGALVPADEQAWAPVPSRNMSMSMTQGRQYQLAQLQAGAGSLTLDDPDGAFIPGQPPVWQVQWNGTGTNFPGLQSGTLTVTAGQYYSYAAWIQAESSWPSGAYVYFDWQGSGGHIAYTNGSIVATSALTPGMSVVSAQAPTGATGVLVGLAANQTPPSAVVFQALAGPVLAGNGLTLSVTVPPSVAWAANNASSVTVLAPWAPGFYGVDSGTPVRVRQYWAGGAWQLQITGNGSTNGPQAESGSAMPVTVGTTYTANAWLAASAAWASGMQLAFFWYTAANGFISATAATFVPSGTQPVLATVTGTAPATANHAHLCIGALGTPASTIVFTAAAAPAQGAATYLAPPPNVTWGAENGATVTTLAAWTADRRGAPNPTPWAVPFGAYVQQLPPQWTPDTQRGITQVTLVDILGYANGNLQNIIRDEILADAPYAYWPLTDVAGSTSGSNLAPGNTNPIIQTQSKYGQGPGAGAFGQNSGGIFGDTGTIYTSTSQSSTQQSTMWGQTIAVGQPFTATHANPCVFTLTGGGTNYSANEEVYIAGNSLPGGFTQGNYIITAPSGSTFTLAASLNAPPLSSTSTGSGVVVTTLQTQQGAALVCTDGGFPPITNGVTVSCWFESTASLYAGAIIFCLTTAAGPIIQAQLQNGTGALGFSYWPAGSTTGTFITIDGGNFAPSTAPSYVTLSFNRTGYTAWWAGGAAAVSGTFSGSLPAKFTNIEAGGRVDHSATAFFFSGYLGHLAVFPTRLPQVRVLNQYVAGAFGCAGDSASARVERLLGAAGITGRRQILTEQPVQSAMVSCQDIGGQPAATSLANITGGVPPGFMLIAPNGDLYYLAHSYAYNSPVAWVLGENAWAGELPYEPDFSLGYDPARLVNLIQLTQLDSQAIVTPSLPALEAASQLKYGPQTLETTGYLQGTPTSAYTAGTGLEDQANWIATTYATPSLRVVQASVDAASKPYAWWFFMTVSPGDMITVNRRPPTQSQTAPMITVTGRVIQSARTLTFGAGKVTAQVTLVVDIAPEENALTLDDPVRGLLNGSNVLGM